MGTRFFPGESFQNLEKEKMGINGIYLGVCSHPVFEYEHKMTQTISFVLILEDDVFQREILPLVAANRGGFASLFAPAHLSFSFGLDQKTLRFYFAAGHHRYLSREGVSGGEGAVFVCLFIIHRKKPNSHDERLK